MKTVLPWQPTLVALVCLVATLGSPVATQAGFVAGVVLEDKGIWTPLVPVKVFTSSMYIKLVSGWGPRDGEEHFRLNGEKIILVPGGPPVHVYNLYPALFHVPQPLGLADPDAPIDFFSVMVVDQGSGIGPLPDTWVLDSAEVVDGRGVSHPATITPIHDLRELPTSSLHNTQIQWDLSPLAKVSGNFFLARFTMTGNELAPQPAPDLIIESIVPGTDTPVADQAFTVAVTVKNQGHLNAGPFNVALFKNAASAPTNAGGSDADVVVSGLNSGQTTVVNLDATYDAAGSYTFWAMADSGAAIAESDESNNADSVIFTVADNGSGRGRCGKHVGPANLVGFYVLCFGGLALAKYRRSGMT